MLGKLGVRLTAAYNHPHLADIATFGGLVDETNAGCLAMPAAEQIVGQTLTVDSGA